MSSFLYGILAVVASAPVFLGMSFFGNILSFSFSIDLYCFAFNFFQFIITLHGLPGNSSSTIKNHEFI